jgi:phosphoribosylamine-glycine ligase
MKILLVSHDSIGAWLLLRLIEEGCECDWVSLDPSPQHQRTLSGLIPPPLPKLPPKVDHYDLVIFDSTGNGELAEEMREQTPVIGDGAINSRLEDDRLYGIKVMEECGIDVPPYEEFQSPDEARAFLEANPKRYVYKPSAPADGEDQDCATTYVSESAEDMDANLERLFEDSGGAPFILQEFVEGVEISTEAYFDGTNFYLHNHTLEEKKFMDGGHGPNTGCAGNLIWATNGPNRIFTHGLGRMVGWLREAGYCGMVDLNTIATPLHLYGLEFTPRFGYDASPSLFALMDSPLYEFLYEIATGPASRDISPELSGRWAASVRFSIPPYPTEIEGQHPEEVSIKGIALEDAWRNCYLWDAQMTENGLATVGINGFICAPIGVGHSPEGAWQALERLTKKITIPNAQRRGDLESCTLKRLTSLKELGWL